MLQTFDRIGPFIVVLSQSEAIPARKRRVVVRCVVCERVSEMNEKTLLDKRTEEQRGCAKCRVYTTNGTWVKGWKAKMENAAIEANRLNKENADLRDEIDKVLRERDEARAAEEHLRGQHQYSIGLSMALEERDQARRERDLALGRLENEIKAANQARMAEERARESLDELDAAIYECLPSDYDDDSPLDCVEHAADRLRELAEERDEARAEIFQLREALATAGERLKACAYELTEFSYQELASVLFDLPTSTFQDAGDECEVRANDAYRRGAEAMREACAVALMSDGLVLSRERAAKVVRALPIPEDK